jgi:phosphopantothenoylcysteine decarboxylase/phosphopantothenate--cysteine ligase
MKRDVLRGKRIVLGVTGSIAAYKAVALASALHQAGAIVDVAMTREATELIRPLSFQAITHRPVALEMFALLAETEIGHVTLGQQADAIVIAPATAHTLAKIAHGLSDDLVTTTLLASTAPVIIAPAMDAGMYESPAVRENVEKLRGRGYHLVEPGFGHLASGRVGQGRLADQELIVGTLRQVLGRRGDLAGWRLVVTAGGTQEAIDPVRVITNRSSGKMGYALAEAARDRGADVVLISAPTSLPRPVCLELRRIESAEQLRQAVLAELERADALIMAAAVADYRPRVAADQKIKKSASALSIELEPTVDVLAETAALAPPGLLRVGFAAESENLLENARGKLERKRLDLIVANDISLPDSGFASELNKATILGRDGLELDLPSMAKYDLAHEILDQLVPLRLVAPAAIRNQQEIHR